MSNKLALAALLGATAASGEWLMIDRGQWGDWNEGASGKDGFYACGAQLR